MRLIDADALIDFANRLYGEAAAMNDARTMAEMAIAMELVRMQPTLNANIVNAKYDGLDKESRKAFDMLLDCMYEETLKRKRKNEKG